jgi:hypothetical protein
VSHDISNGLPAFISIMFEVKLKKCKPLLTSIGIELGIDYEKVDREIVFDGVKYEKVQSRSANQFFWVEY